MPAKRLFGNSSRRALGLATLACLVVLPGGVAAAARPAPAPAHPALVDLAAAGSGWSDSTAVAVMRTPDGSNIIAAGNADIGGGVTHAMVWTIPLGTLKPTVTDIGKLTTA